MNKISFNRGFTIVELMVAVAVTSILGVSVVSFATEQFRLYSVANSRTLLASEVQRQIQMISDDIRSSSGVAQYNGIPDNNAPQSLLFSGTTGPAEQKYYWRSASAQLVLERVPVTTANEPIYDNATTLAGKKDYIVYYVRDNSLYRRVVPADYPNNKQVISSCATSYPAGGCDSDRRLSRNLRNGASGFQVTYLAKNGSTVPTVDPATVQRVSVKLDVQTNSSGRTLQVDETTQVGFRTAKNGQEPINLDMTAAAIAGPGGIYLQASAFQQSNPARIYNGAVHTLGKLTVSYAQIGESANPVAVNVHNNGCYSGTTFEPCTDQPISFINGGNIYGNVCARLQTDSSRISNLLPSTCVRPTVSLPRFNRQGFVDSMSNGTIVNSGAYNCVNGGVITIPANTIIEGGVSSGGGGCTINFAGNVYIKGDLAINSASTLRAMDSTEPAINVVVTGRVSMGNATNVYASANGTKLNITSLFSTSAACTASTTCTDGDLSDTYVYDTLQQSAAIALNGAQGGGLGIVYSVFGLASLNYSSVAEGISGQRIELRNQSRVTGPT